MKILGVTLGWRPLPTVDLLTCPLTFTEVLTHLHVCIMKSCMPEVLYYVYVPCILHQYDSATEMGLQHICDVPPLSKHGWFFSVFTDVYMDIPRLIFSLSPPQAQGGTEMY